MIGKQLQTRILQPAKTVVDANILDAISSTGNQKSGGGGGGSSGGGSSGGGGYAAPAPDYATQIESNTQRLYESTFRPDPIERQVESDLRPRCSSADLTGIVDDPLGQQPICRDGDDAGSAELGAGDDQLRQIGS